MGEIKQESHIHEPGHDLHLPHEGSTVHFSNQTISVAVKILAVLMVLATALMASALKAIMFDFEQFSPPYLYGNAAVICALGATYWLITKKARS